MRKPYVNAIIKNCNACKNAGTQLFYYALDPFPVGVKSEH